MAPSTPPELDTARVQAWCRQRVPEHLRDLLRIECDLDARSMTIIESRPPWDPGMGTDWTRFPIARLRYTKTSQTWSLYWRDRNLRWHAYDRPATKHVEELLGEIDRDPTGIFWG